jgi:D-aspartate ligase
VWPTGRGEQRGALVAGLRDIGRRLGGPVVVLPTDDEAADLLAGCREELADVFVQPAVAASLPGRLADKQGLYELCREHGVPTPETVVARSAAELRGAAERLGLPVVVKNIGPWDRLAAPVVGSTTVLHAWEDVSAMQRSLSRSGSTTTGPPNRRPMSRSPATSAPRCSPRPVGHTNRPAR